MNYRHIDKTCFFLANPGYIFVSLGYTTALVNTSCKFFVLRCLIGSRHALIVKNVCNTDNLILGYARGGSDMPGSPYYRESAIECCELCVASQGTSLVTNLFDCPAFAEGALLMLKALEAHSVG